jgi:TonB-linked SusC/RagA family outer membrane protein
MQQQGYQITGTVVDEDGEELIGVAVQLKSNPNVGAVTDVNGRFTLGVGSMNETLVFSYVGMKTLEMRLVVGTTNYDVTMGTDEAVLGEVVVTGIMGTRDKFGFTGAAHTIQGEEVRAVGNINLLQSLRSLDPSFVVMDNLLEGSNPNVMANIELRGATALDFGETAGGVSNTPLFIMDGFEATIQQVSDLDINRIESITILKDASSTAIYGSKGANGVLVIETIKPQGGQVQVSYSTNQRIGWADLSQYNLMDAREKLEFERRAGLFGNLDNAANQSGMNTYSQARRRIEMGAESDWLRMPIRLAHTNVHSMRVSGGADAWQFTSGFSYRGVQGVMKGSGRESFAGNVNLLYRRNNLSISNNLQIEGTTGKDGSWGSFSAFAGASPHQVPFDENGTLLKFLESRVGSGTDLFANPLWDATLDTYANSKNFIVTNNTGLNWHIHPQLHASGRLQIRQENSSSSNYKDPRDTQFADRDYRNRGFYSIGNSTNFSYSADANIAYSKIFNGAHVFTVTGRTSIEEGTRESSSFIAVGFPEGAEPTPSFAYGFQEGSRPRYSWVKTRRASFVGLLTYNYKLRYLFDASVSHNGSTAFGSNNPFKSYYSFGTGWNVDREEFAQDWTWFDELKIRASLGTNANQTGNLATTSVYGYYPGSDMFGTASKLDVLGNNYLQWLSVTKMNVGFDAAFLDRRLRLTADIYKETGDPQVVSMAQKASSGIRSYQVSLGKVVTKGYEFRASYALIHNVRERKILTLRATGGGNVGRYYNFRDALNALNNELFSGEDATTESMLQRYEDGNRRDDIWAVRSLGIDPATGKEIFLTKDGIPTYTYNRIDRVKIASSSPVISGILGANLVWKQFEGGFSLRYNLGGHQLNRAMYERIENISGGRIAYNQDKRALYHRWDPEKVDQNQRAQFKSVSLTNQTPISSRFVQKNNQLRGESVNLNWNFSRSEWIKQFGLQTLTMGISMNDIFYLSSIRDERSINYPFERAVSFNLSAMF